MHKVPPRLIRSASAICAGVTLILGALVVGVSPAAANGCITGAAGTSLDPFLIEDVVNLECLRDNASYYWHRGYYFKQTADIDLSATTDWTHGIGDDSDTFNGTYDGDGFTIDALTVNGTTETGLFDNANGATLMSITLVDPTVTSSFGYVGALAGYVDDTTSISDVHVINGGAGATVFSAGNSYGGLIGSASGGSVITNSSSAARVAGGFSAIAGGLIGIAENVSITDSFATGDASAVGVAGSLVGAAVAPVNITRSFSTGNATDSLSGAGGLIGVAATDDTYTITIDQSFATGDSISANGPAGGLVGLTEQSGPTGGQQLIITDSYSTGSATGRWAAGGIVGQADAIAGQSLNVTRTYSAGTVDAADVTADDSAGGLLGVEGLGGAAVITDSFWNPTDAGPAATAVFGTESTQGAMRSPSLFASAGWSISDRAPAATTWTSCAAYNSGNPILQWYATAQGWSCASPPPPPPIYPPSAPLDVAGIAGDDAAAVSWLTPASSGSFTVSNYQVVAAPGGRSCLTSTLTCAVTGLANGTAYTFTVRALNGAGWGPWSAASATVTPGAPTVMISGVRAQVRGRPGVIVSGTSTLQMGAILRPWVKFPGPTTFGEGSAQVLADESGDFTWQRRTGKRTGKKVYVYMTAGDLTSNRIVIRP